MSLIEQLSRPKLKKENQKPFVVYIPQLNKISIVDNIYGLDKDIAMGLLRIGLKRKYTIEYIGEL